MACATPPELAVRLAFLNQVPEGLLAVQAAPRQSHTHHSSRTNDLLKNSAMAGKLADLLGCKMLRVFLQF